MTTTELNNLRLSLLRLKQVARKASKLPGYDSDYGLGDEWKQYTIEEYLETINDLLGKHD